MKDNVEIDLQEFFKVLAKRFWIVLLCMVLAGTSALVYTKNFVNEQYKANVSFYVNVNPVEDSSYIDSQDLAVALRLANSYVEIIRKDVVLDAVIKATEMKISAAQLRGMITAEVVGETEMFTVTVTSTSPQKAAVIANAIADIAPGIISEIIKGSEAKIIDKAKVPTAPSSPNYTTNTIIGALAGAAIAVLVILLQTLMDVRVKGEEDLMKICDIPVLGVIPELNMDGKTKAKKRGR